METVSIEEVLRDTGRKHHQAFTTSDGVDPEWALWYAAHLQTRLWDRLGRVPTRSELVFLLIDCDRAFQEAGGDRDWPTFYSERFAEYFGS